MLTEQDFIKIEKQAAGIYQNLELQIIEEIATRIANFGYANTVVINDLKIAEEMGYLYEDIVKLVAEYNNTTVEEVSRIFYAAGEKSLKFDDKIYKEAGLNPKPLNQSESIKQIMNATIERTTGNLQNLCMTTAATTQTQFYNAINKAYMEVSTGVKSYSQSILDAVKDVSSQGAYITYPSGRRMSLESAVRMNVITSINQNCGKLQENRANEMSWDLMELTAHGGARPEHANWQGKIVSLSGQKGYLSKKDIGYGTATGFKGVNCKHDWYPYYKGSARTYTQKQLDAWKNEKVEYNGKKISKYEATQIQRKMERQIRNDKRNIAGLNGILRSNKNDERLVSLVKSKLIDKENKLKLDNILLNDFINQTNLKKDNARLYVEKKLINKSESDIILRNKSGIRGLYSKSQKEVEEICNNELKNIKFPAKVLYNARVINGRTKYTRYSWGEIKEIVAIEIGKQQKESKEFLIDTLLHEKLEAKILIVNTEKYRKLNNISETKRHEYINKVITRYFNMKGWNNGNR